MLSKKEIKDIQSLTHKKYRDESGLFVAEGTKIATELLQVIPKEVQTIYATGEWLKENKNLDDAVEIKIITEQELQKVSQLHTPNGVLLVVRKFESTVPTLNNEFCLYLDAIQDPGNMGTIIRIADWFNIKHIVCSNGCADIYNPKVVQSSMVSIARVNVYYDDDLQWLQKQNTLVYAAVLNGKSVYSCEKISNGILLIGNESKGIRTEFLNLSTEKITIPNKGEADSLNAAVATGIILSHLLY